MNRSIKKKIKMFENTGDNGNLTSTNGFGFSCFLAKTNGFGFSCFENIGAADNGVAGFFQSEKAFDDEIQSFDK